LHNQIFQKLTIWCFVLKLFMQYFLYFFLYLLNHIKSNFHFIHSTLINFSTFKYFFWNFNIIFYLFERGGVFSLCFILNFIDFILLLLISFFVDEAKLLYSVLFNHSFKALKSFFKDLMTIDYQISHEKYYLINVRN